MKLDYKFIKDILKKLEEDTSYQMDLGQLMRMLDINNTDSQDKFFGHVKILGDYCCIETSNNNYGITYGSGNSISINTGVRYRLTARGYEFLDVLKNDTVFNKIKDLALPMAFEIGKSVLTKILTG